MSSDTGLIILFGKNNEKCFASSRYGHGRAFLQACAEELQRLLAAGTQTQQIPSQRNIDVGRTANRSGYCRILTADNSHNSAN